MRKLTIIVLALLLVTTISYARYEEEEYIEEVSGDTPVYSQDDTPLIRFNTSTQKIQFSSDGSTWNDMGLGDRVHKIVSATFVDADSGDSVITEISEDFTITGYKMVNRDTADTIIMDIWVASDGSIPTNTDSILSSALSVSPAAQDYSGTTTDFSDTTINQYDNIILNIDSCGSTTTDWQFILRGTWR